LIESSRSPVSQRPAASSEHPYAALGHGPELHPALEVRLYSRSGAEFPVRALVDSGADCSCFPEEFAEPLGVDLEECIQQQVHTGNGLAIHYCSEKPVRASIAGRDVQLAGTFGPIGVAVLGRDDFFAEFLVTVNHLERTVILMPHGCS
jgi:hypothetical protein